MGLLSAILGGGKNRKAKSKQHKIDSLQYAQQLKNMKLSKANAAKNVASLRASQGAEKNMAISSYGSRNVAGSPVATRLSKRLAAEQGRQMGSAKGTLQNIGQQIKTNQSVWEKSRQLNKLAKKQAGTDLLISGLTTAAGFGGVADKYTKGL